tara:strand:- start:148 stop:819 length:672 start_codon:yes stop_codon:yes gene_type:complete
VIKTNWESDRASLEKQRIFSDTIPKDIFDWLKNKCFEVKEKNNDTSNIVRNYSLKFVLFKEHDASVSANIPPIRYLKNDETYFKLQTWLSHQCFNPTLNMFNAGYFILSEDRPLKISAMWVNFQKKYEFNPPHSHGGVFSFIIFVKIPYKLENETYDASKLYFQTQTPIHLHGSGITTTHLNVDESFEGKILIFPSQLIHGVHPFYTSDGYRITISGNLVFDV